MSPSISVVIITFNEEHNIKQCLDSVSLFDEIIIVDSGSTDQTIDIAKKHGAKVIHQDWLGFGPQKQFVVSQAKNEWVLSIDADEVLSKELLANIHSLNLHNPQLAYSINRRSFFLGTEVKHSGWNPDWVIRLFNKNHCHFTEDKVHEKVMGYQSMQKLDGLMYHYTYQTLFDIKDKTVKYGQLGKLSRKKAKNKYLNASWSFIRTFFIQFGFLDGLTGYQIAKMNAQTTFIKYS